ncbi:hypothetical protein EV702DRAFT_738173, partial [Suillus placidus]
GKSSKSESKLPPSEKAVGTGHIDRTPRPPLEFHHSRYLPPLRPPPSAFLSPSAFLLPPLLRPPPRHSTRQLVGKAQAPQAPSATSTSHASSATPSPALHNSTALPPSLEPSYLRQRLHNFTSLIPGHIRDTSESDEECGVLDPYGGADAFMEFKGMSPYSSGSVSPALIPAPNLHWQLLSHHPARPNLFLHFDVAFPTHDIEYMQDSSYGIQRTPLPDADLDKPAADKKLTKMTINFRCDLSKWDIDVERDEGVRVRDVFEAIYSAFDLPLTPYEKSLIPLHLRAGCEETFRLRCNLAPVLPIVQQRQGWKRVDALLHETVFRGLAQSKQGGGWILNLSGTMSKAIDRRRLISDHIAADPTARYRVLWDPIV